MKEKKPAKTSTVASSRVLTPERLFGSWARACLPARVARDLRASELEDARGQDLVARRDAGRADVLLDVGAVEEGGVDGAGEVGGGEHEHVGRLARARLADDHQNAQMIAQIVSQTDGLQLDVAKVETNIIVFGVSPKIGTAAEFCEAAKAAGVWMFPFSHQDVRAVTHLHISPEDAITAGEIIAQVAHNLQK